MIFEFPKLDRILIILYNFNILIFKYISYYNDMDLFDISTLKNRANIWYFVYIDF